MLSERVLSKKVPLDRVGRGRRTAIFRLVGTGSLWAPWTGSQPVATQARRKDREIPPLLSTKLRRTQLAKAPI